MENYTNNKDIIEILERLIDSRLDKLKFDGHFKAEVDSVGSGVADVIEVGDTGIIPNIKFRSSLSLSPGDTVYVLKINGSRNNLFIDFKI